jgi:thioredoxin reductase (NADPH)
MESFDIVIIGAGPSGLACAIEAKRQGLSTLVTDKGSVVDAIRRFPIDMTFFSTPELLEIGDMPFTTAGFRPSRVECVRYYQMVARHYALPIRQGVEVKRVHQTATGLGVLMKSGPLVAKNVVVATGYFDNPNRFDVPGSDLPKVERYYSEPYAYVGRSVAVVGGKNSAAETALDLFRNGAKVTLIHRGRALSDGVKYWILPDIENRLKNGEIRRLFETRVREIKPESIVVEGKTSGEIPNDALFVMIGYSPDTTLLREAGVQIDEGSAAPLHDPSTMQTNIKGIYVAGSIAAGKFNNKIFIENGRAHGKLIVDSIIHSR